ncbi:hypothetical protein [Persephonella sp.]
MHTIKINIEKFCKFLRDCEILNKTEDILELKKTLKKQDIEILKVLNENSYIEYIEEVDGTPLDINNEFHLNKIIGYQIKISLNITYIEKELNFTYVSSVKDLIDVFLASSLTITYALIEGQNCVHIDQIEDFKNFRKIKEKLETLLNLIKDYIDSTSKDYIIILSKNKKIKIKEKFNKETFLFISRNFKNIIPILDDILADITNENGRKINIIFFINAIEKVFPNKYEIVTDELIYNLSEIYNEYELFQRSYLNSLDVDKIKQDYQEKILSLVDKLNSLTSDLIMKTIIIPIGFAIAFSQISKNVTKNFIILFFVWFFTLVFLNYLKGLFSIKKIIYNEIKYLENNIKNKENQFEKEIYEKLRILKSSLESFEFRIVLIFTFTVIALILFTIISLSREILNMI